MKINKESIIDISLEGSPLYSIGERLGRYYVLDIISRKFTYELDNDKNVTFDINALRNIFYNATIYPKNKPILIKGIIKLIDFEESKQFILSDFSHSESRLSQEDITNYMELFWKEVNMHCELPPSVAYIHIPVEDSYFDEWALWKFCYIYLNNNTKQGIVIAANACD